MTQPKLFPVPFANAGDKNDLSINRLSGDAPQKVNFTEGFPTVTEQPKSAGGKAPLRKDFNGVLYHLTDNAKHLQQGMSYHFDPSFAAAIGGYPKGATLLSDDGSTRYVSLVDGNTSDFNVSIDPLKWAKTSMTQAQVMAAHGCVRFLSDGSFTVPDDVYTIFVSAAAGGGGGGGGAGSSGTTTGVGGGGGGGGGAGQQAVKAPCAVTPGQVIPIVIGAGGIAGVGSGTNGGDGGITSIGALLSLSGGIGGKRGGWATIDAFPHGGGAGGFGGAGYPDGADGIDGNYMGSGGTGASSPFGGGGASGRAGTGSAGMDTSDGGFAGTGGGGFGTGGGGGGASYGNLSGKGGNGGTGARGIVIIEW